MPQVVESREQAGLNWGDPLNGSILQMEKPTWSWCPQLHCHNASPLPTAPSPGRISAPAMVLKLCGSWALYFTSLRFQFPLLLKQNHVPDLTGLV